MLHFTIGLQATGIITFDVHGKVCGPSAAGEGSYSKQVGYNRKHHHQMGKALYYI